MAELNDWQWAIGAAVLIASLVLGGWLSRERIDQQDQRTSSGRRTSHSKHGNINDQR